MRSRLTTTVALAAALTLLGCPSSPPKNPGNVVQDGGSSSATSGTSGSQAGSAPVSGSSSGSGSGAGSGSGSVDGGRTLPAADGGDLTAGSDAAIATHDAGADDASVAPTTCGGFAGRPCPDGATCVDDPSDSCDPNSGGADCGGICVAGVACGKNTCTGGQTCCNASCGICADPGSACIQIACL